MLTRLEAALPAGTAACALRIDGEFARVRARSVPRQEKPYKPLTEVVDQQHVFEFQEIPGTLVGVRFPDYSGEVEVSGFHLHFISADRRRGGHVLDCEVIQATAGIDPSSELRIELPPGVDLSDDHLDFDVAAAARRVEHHGALGAT